MGGTANIKSGSIWVNKLEPAIFVTFSQLVLHVADALRVLSWSLFGLLRLAISDTHQFFAEASISNECFLWMQVLIKVLTNNRVSVDADADLLEQSVNVSAKLSLTSLSEANNHTTSLLDEGHQVLQLMACEGLSWTTNHNKVQTLKSLLGHFCFVHSALRICTWLV